MFSAQSWGPGVVWCSLLPCGLHATGSLPPGQLREGAFGGGSQAWKEEGSREVWGRLKTRRGSRVLAAEMAASAAVSPPVSGWSLRSRQLGTSHSRLCKPCRSWTPAPRHCGNTHLRFPQSWKSSGRAGYCHWRPCWCRHRSSLIGSNTSWSDGARFNHNIWPEFKDWQKWQPGFSSSVLCFALPPKHQVNRTKITHTDKRRMWVCGWGPCFAHRQTQSLSNP